jgi:hypothetical protein
MDIYSLSNTQLKDNKLYDLIYPMLIDLDFSKVILDKYVVYEEREMRMDLVCLDIYSSMQYMDELMHLNGIIDPYSIKIGDIIYYPSVSILTKLRNSYIDDDDDLEIESNQKSSDGSSLTTSISDNYIPIMVDKNNNTIIITNKLK